MNDVKISLDFSTVEDFSDFSQHVGFTTDAVTNQNIKRNLEQLKALVASGDLAALPHDADAEAIRDSEPVTFGEEIDSEGDRVQYHVVPVYMRVRTYIPGKRRAGSKGLTLGGKELDEASDSGLIS